MSISTFLSLFIITVGDSTYICPYRLLKELFVLTPQKNLIYHKHIVLFISFILKQHCFEIIKEIKNISID